MQLQSLLGAVWAWPSGEGGPRTTTQSCVLLLVMDFAILSRIKILSCEYPNVEEGWGVYNLMIYMFFQCNSIVFSNCSRGGSPWYKLDPSLLANPGSILWYKLDPELIGALHLVRVNKFMVHAKFVNGLWTLWFLVRRFWSKLNYEALWYPCHNILFS